MDDGADINRITHVETVLATQQDVAARNLFKALERKDLLPNEH